MRSPRHERTENFVIPLKTGIQAFLTLREHWIHPKGHMYAGMVSVKIATLRCRIKDPKQA